MFSIMSFFSFKSLSQVTSPASFPDIDFFFFTVFTRLHLGVRCTGKCAVDAKQRKCTNKCATDAETLCWQGFTGGEMGASDPQSSFHHPLECFMISCSVITYHIDMLLMRML